VNIVVCIKQVPDVTQVRINPETNTLVREGVANMINPFDMYAIEEGVRLKEKHGGIVTVLSMGPPQAEAALREAISMGCDKAVLLSDRAFAGADTLATSYTLAAGIRQVGRDSGGEGLGVDVVVMGRQTMEGDTAQVGPETAENLGIPHVTDVRKIEEVSDGAIVLERLLENGYLRLKARLPILVTVVKEINLPRIPSLRGKMAAKKAEIRTLGVAALPGVDPDRVGLTGSPTQVVRIFTPPKPAGGKLFTGEAKDTAAQLIAELKAAGLRLGGGQG
jgi:electron transfer flavoprotein beta subunit